MSYFPVTAVANRVVEVVIDMYKDGKGTPDPSLVEIAQADARANGSLSALTDVAKVEGSVRATLINMLNSVGHQRYFIVPLNRRYYETYRLTGVVTIDDARKCIAGRGHAMYTAGFIFLTDPNHPLMKAYFERDGRAIEGWIEAWQQQVSRAIEAGMLTDGGRETVMLPDAKASRNGASAVAKQLAAQHP